MKNMHSSLILRPRKVMYGDSDGCTTSGIGRDEGYSGMLGV